MRAPCRSEKREEPGSLYFLKRSFQKVVMKLRLVSRLMVLALVVVVGVIIILHQHAATSASPAATPTPTTGAQWPDTPPPLALNIKKSERIVLY